MLREVIHEYEEACKKKPTGDEEEKPSIALFKLEQVIKKQEIELEIIKKQLQEQDSMLELSQKQCESFRNQYDCSQENLNRVIDEGNLLEQRLLG